MKTLKLLWEILGTLASITLVVVWTAQGLRAENPETQTLYFIGAGVVLIFHEVTKKSK